MSEFIGSVISLISKRDIRYKGTLHSINSENHTVALELVKSYGTEGRRNGVGEVEPRPEIYDYIVFRGSDVKELSIEEPAPVDTAPAHQDPAIIDAKRPSNPPSQPVSNPPPGYPDYPLPYNHHGPSYPMHDGNLAGPYGRAGPYPPPPMGYQPYSQYPPQHPVGGQQVSPPSSTKPAQALNQRPMNHSSSEVPAESGTTSSPAAGALKSQSTSSHGTPKPAEPAGETVAPSLSKQETKSHPVDQVKDTRAKSEQSVQSQSQSRFPARGGHGAPHRSGDQAGSRNQSGPANTASWEKTNAQFQELALSEKPANAPEARPESAAEVKEKPSAEVKVPSYDKGKSFFDNISSDLRDREDGRDRQFRENERRRNLETFGQGSVDSSRHRGGYGGYHRGRGRGGQNPNYRPRGTRGPAF